MKIYISSCLSVFLFPLDLGVANFRELTLHFS